MIKSADSRLSLLRVLGSSAVALLALGIPIRATPLPTNPPTDTWTAGTGIPIWNLNNGTFSGNWSAGANPGQGTNIIFPAIVPATPNAATFTGPFSLLTDGHTIVVGAFFGGAGEGPAGLPIATAGVPGSITFLNNYTLVDGSAFGAIFAPPTDGPPTFVPKVGFGNSPALLTIGNGNVMVESGMTVTIDLNIQALNGTLNKTGTGTLLLNDLVIGNILIETGVLGGNFTATGSLVNMGTLSPGNSPGKVIIQGNYQQGKAAVLAMEVASPFVYDRLAVGGKGSLGGILNVSLLNGFQPKKGEKFTIISAGSMSGQFANVNGPVWDLLTLRPFYGKNTVTLKAVVNSFDALPGLTQNQHAVAQNLDQVIFDTRETKVMNYLYGKSLSDLPSQFDKIAPEELTSIFTMSAAYAQQQSLNLQRRTDDLRSGSSGFSAANLAINGQNPSYSGGFDITTGVAGPSGNDSKEVKETKEVAPAENRWGAFVSGTGEWVNVSSTGNAHGYDLASGGFTLGVDYKVCPNFAIGIAAGYTGTTADLVDRGRVWVNGGKFGLYSTTFVGGWYADAAAFGGYNSYDTRRSALQGQARGDTDGGEVDALFGTGYDFKAGGFTFGPTASFNYTYMGLNGFTEHGSLTPLNIHSNDADSLRTAFGLKINYDCKFRGLVIKPELRAAWQHEYGDTAYALDSSFANGAGGTFSVDGPRLGRDSLLLGAGFAIQCSERCSTYIYYDGELGRENYESNAVTGGFRISF